MTQHTPGPWQVRTEGLLRHSILGPNGEIIARYSPWDKNPDQGEEGRANAALLAAAPELLAACEASQQCIKDFIDAYKRGCSMLILDEAVKSLRDDALKLTNKALEKARPS